MTTENDMPIATEERDPTALDHQRARDLLGMEENRDLDESDRNRLHLLLDELHYDGCITETAARRLQIVALSHVTAVLAMACKENDANRLNARALTEILCVLVNRKMPR